MCNLRKHYTETKSFTGYKVIAVKEANGKNFSVAMGFCYDNHKQIPVIKKQSRIAQYFDPRILTSFCHNEYMEGRTAVFKHKVNAILLRDKIENRSKIRKGFRIVIKKATVSDKLMYGYYVGDEIIAGRKIEIHDDQIF